jgi:NitT/TauT family transport system substrate-binding protein
VPYSSTACTLAAYRDLLKAGKKIAKVYLFDAGRKLKLFADQAFFVSGTSSGAPFVEAFMLKKDAESYAAKTSGKVLGFTGAVGAALIGG